MIAQKEGAHRGLSIKLAKIIKTRFLILVLGEWANEMAKGFGNALRIDLNRVSSIDVIGNVQISTRTIFPEFVNLQKTLKNDPWNWSYLETMRKSNVERRGVVSSSSAAENFEATSIFISENPTRMVLACPKTSTNLRTIKASSKQAVNRQPGFRLMDS